VKPQIQPLRDGDPKSFQGWTLKGLIGEGGQSTIFLAEKNGTRAALKMIRKEYLANEKSVDRFFTEIKNLELLNHPNISRVIEVEDSGKFLAIEFIDGPNLEDYVNDSGPLESGEWESLAQILATTVDYCHSKGIIHKDISPRNIIIGPNGPVLVDFGISYLEKDARLTSDGETIGTPPFMSPEHFGVTAPKQMDVFCLGGTLIFAGTGHYPFSGSNSSEWRESILFGPPDFNGLSSEQISLLAPLLYKKPEDRGSIQDFSRLLEELARNGSSSKSIKKNFARVKLESQSKLIQKKKNLAVKRKTLRNAVSLATIVSLLSVGLVTSGIFLIQSNSGEDPAKGKSTRTAPVNLTADQRTKAAACKNLASFGDFQAAVVACKEPAELGDTWAQYSLGLSLEELGNESEGEKWVFKAAQQALPEAMAGMAANEINRKNYSKALEWAKQAAKSGNLVGVEAVGISYAYLKQYDLAVEWYKKSWELGDIQGARNLGYHYWFEFVDKDEASKWLKLAAETKSSVEGVTSFDYAEFLRREAKNYVESCKWYKKSSDLNFIGNDKDALSAYKTYCRSIKVQAKSSSSPSPKTSPSAANSGSAILSSESFKVSAPIAANVAKDSIFGRAFIDGLNYWRIPLTNSKTEKVPALTAIQFRMIGYENAGWMDVPYKLKTDSTFGTVYAEVDDMLFAVIFKNVKYCPEFRAAREVNGKIIQIWEKGLPECSTDYNG
jgi:serine/threonine protein kinase/tetratricopeptide (TPR) repeat protein